MGLKSSDGETETAPAQTGGVRHSDCGACVSLRTAGRREEDEQIPPDSAGPSQLRGPSLNTEHAPSLVLSPGGCSHYVGRGAGKIMQLRAPRKTKASCRMAGLLRVRSLMLTVHSQAAGDIGDRELHVYCEYCKSELPSS